MNGQSAQQGQPASVKYDIVLSEQEAAMGLSRVLERGGKRLEVKIPANVQTGRTIRLRNALRITDGRDGDILVTVRVQAAAGERGVLVVTDASFEREVLKSAVPVLVDFWAPWCGPCRMVAPVVEKLCAEYAGRVKFCKLNVDENRLASQRYQVMSIPTVILFKKGLIADMSVGAELYPAPEGPAREPSCIARQPFRGIIDELKISVPDPPEEKGYQPPSPEIANDIVLIYRDCNVPERWSARAFDHYITRLDDWGCPDGPLFDGFVFFEIVGH